MIISSLSLVSNQHDKSCLNIPLLYFLFRVVKDILYHFCFDMLTWYQISELTETDTKLNYFRNGFQELYKVQRQCHQGGATDSPYLFISLSWQRLSLLAQVFFLSRGGLPQGIFKNQILHFIHLAVCTVPLSKITPFSPPYKDGEVSKIFHLFSILKCKTNYSRPIYLKNNH